MQWSTYYSGFSSITNFWLDRFHAWLIGGVELITTLLDRQVKLPMILFFFPARILELLDGTLVTLILMTRFSCSAANSLAGSVSVADC